MAAVNPFNATLEYRKKTFERLFYTDLMTVEGMREETNLDTNLTSQKRVIIAEDVPCRLSINGYPSIMNKDTHKESNASLKLFTSPDADLQEGDLVTVTRNANTTVGVKQVFKLISGKPLIYDSHMEVVMDERTGV